MKKILHTASLFLLMFLFTQNSYAKAPSKQVFPKLAGIHYGAPKNYENEEYQKQMAKQDIIIFGFSKDDDIIPTVRDIAKKMKQLNPNIILANYTVINEAYNSRNVKILEKLSSEKGPMKNGEYVGDWWARTAKGKNVSTYPKTWSINLTRFTTPDKNGDRYPEWYAKYWKQDFLNVPEFDIWFVDNVFYKPRELTDWNGDGKDDDPNSENVKKWYREGTADHIRAIRKEVPKKMIMGNIDGHAGKKTGNLSEREYKGIFEGGFMEAGIGRFWSAHSQGGWSGMMWGYRELLKNTIQPKIVIVNIFGKGNDYKTFRYGFASVLMDNGYYGFTEDGFDYNKVTWFDEYDLSGEGNTSWLGKAVDQPQYKAWQQGIYKREFENGLVLVNPEGNGSQTFSLGESAWKRIQGKQDTAVNNGKDIGAQDRITLPEGDGLLLRRKNYQGAPGDIAIKKSCELIHADRNVNLLPEIFAPPFEIFAKVRETFIHALCENNTNNVDIIIGEGISGVVRYIYNKSYLWKGDTWTEIPLTCTKKPSVEEGVWCNGEAKGKIPDIDASNRNYFISYVCEWVPKNGWKCGCSDTSCSASKWSLQIISET